MVTEPPWGWLGSRLLTKLSGNSLDIPKMDICWFHWKDHLTYQISSNKVQMSLDQASTPERRGKYDKWCTCDLLRNIVSTVVAYLPVRGCLIITYIYIYLYNIICLHNISRWFPIFFHGFLSLKVGEVVRKMLGNSYAIRSCMMRSAFAQSVGASQAADASVQTDTVYPLVN